MTWAQPSGHRRRWPEVIAAILAYVAAMYFSYVDTFIYFLDSPFHPSGPYGSIPNGFLGTVGANTCLAPHLVFGQICRDWSEQATSTSSRLGFGAVFLIGFLVLALLARRFAWILLVVPLATIPYAHTERKVWAVSALVASSRRAPSWDCGSWLVRRRIRAPAFFLWVCWSPGRCAPSCSRLPQGRPSHRLTPSQAS